MLMPGDDASGFDLSGAGAGEINQSGGETSKCSAAMTSGACLESPRPSGSPEQPASVPVTANSTATQTDLLRVSMSTRLPAGVSRHDANLFASERVTAMPRDGRARCLGTRSMYPSVVPGQVREALTS